MTILTPSEYPETLKIGNNIWEIKIVNRVRGEKASGGKKIVGLCDPKTRVIYLAANVPFAEMFYTLIHEVLHAFEFEYNLKVTHKQIYELERCLGDFLVSNF